LGGAEALAAEPAVVSRWAVLVAKTSASRGAELTVAPLCGSLKRAGLRGVNLD